MITLSTVNQKYGGTQTYPSNLALAHALWAETGWVKPLY